ncbi:MAG: hypothetical protein DHS20C12_07580 [Pseudohongiella sp.]|nr:MAG: hypothetical protein DHS20C12_07580 [Pseudohongiella sp.]
MTLLASKGLRALQNSLLTAGCAIALSACASNPNEINFERMDPLELMAYNQSVDFWDQVYCSDEIRAGSHIRRRYCETLIEIQERLNKAVSEVNVLSTTRTY